MSLNDLISAVQRLDGAVAYMDPLQQSGRDPLALPDWVPSFSSAGERVVQISGTGGLDIPYGSLVPQPSRPGLLRTTGLPQWQVPLDGTDESASPESPQPIEPPAGWEARGLELLAWYSPYHLAPWHWGVFLRAFGIEQIGRALREAGVPSVSIPALAQRFLLNHELTHYRVELAMTSLELATQRALFLDGRRAQVARSGWGMAEEGLANAHARSGLHQSYRSAMDGWLASSPPGYKDWARHRPAKSSLSWAEVISDLVDAPTVPWVPVPGKPDWAAEVPVFIVLDGSGAGGMPSPALLGPIVVEEAESFRKDVERSGNAKNLMRAWESTKRKMANGSTFAGVHLHPIQRNLWSVNLGSAYRAGLERRGPGDWLAVMVDQQHDRLYQRMRRKYML